MINWPLAVSTWGDEEVDAMNSVIKSGFFSMGQLTKQFEEEFAKWAGSRFALMVNSGSSANLIAATGLRYTRNKSIAKNANVDEKTFNINTRGIEQAITQNTVGICGVNLLGSPANWDEIKDIARRNNLWTFEDNCESMGASIGEKKTGTFGDVGTFSFFFSNHICTMEGGMILCDDEEIYLAMRSLRAHGWSRELGDSDTFLGEPRGSAWEENFRFYLPGYNVRPIELSAAVGLEQLKKFNFLLDQRKRNAKILLSELELRTTDWRLQAQNGDSSWFTFGFVNKNLKLGNSRREKLIKLLDENGIQSRPIVAGDFTRNPVYQYIDAEISESLDGADLIHNSGFMVGNHHLDLTEQIRIFCDLLTESER